MPHQEADDHPYWQGSHQYPEQITLSHGGHSSGCQPEDKCEDCESDNEHDDGGLWLAHAFLLNQTIGWSGPVMESANGSQPEVRCSMTSCPPQPACCTLIS